MPIRTIKIPYSCSDEKYWAEYALISKQQAVVTRFSFNRFLDGLSETQIRHLLPKLNSNKNTDIIPVDSWLREGGIEKAKYLFNSQISMKNQQNSTLKIKVVFAANALKSYLKGKISKQELKEARRFGIYSLGEALNKGNRKFNFVSQTIIEFKPQKGTKFSLLINPSTSQKKYLNKIINLANSKIAPITVKLTRTHIHLSFDVLYMQDKSYKPKTNRIMGIDVNPNRYGFCIKDNNKIIKSESFDLINLRSFLVKGEDSSSPKRKRLNNKKTHELIELAHYIVKQAKSMHCEYIALEMLKGMKAKSNNKNFNRSVNVDFKRTKFKEIIEKLCCINGIRLLEIIPKYTSFMGCVLYGDQLPDPISASACIADAGLHRVHQTQNGIKWTSWYNSFKIDVSLYDKSKYLNQWKKEDLCFNSVFDLYSSVKTKFISVGAMKLSYHSFLCSYATRIMKHKSEKSLVKRIYVL